MKNRRRYPRDWQQLARAAKERANWRCERCNVKHGFIRISLWTGRAWPVWLQAAHLDKQDTANTEPCLAALCPACHWRYDRETGARPPRWFIEKLKHRKLLNLQRECNAYSVSVTFRRGDNPHADKLAAHLGIR